MIHVGVQYILVIVVMFQYMAIVIGAIITHLVFLVAIGMIIIVQVVY